MNPDATLFRTRPRLVEARQVIAEDWERCEDIARWAGVATVGREDYLSGSTDLVMWVRSPNQYDWVAVEDGDWLIKQGSALVRVTDDEFRASYEPAVQL